MANLWVAMLVGLVVASVIACNNEPAPSPTPIGRSDEINRSMTEPVEVTRVVVRTVSKPVTRLVEQTVLKPVTRVVRMEVPVTRIVVREVPVTVVATPTRRLPTLTPTRRPVQEPTSSPTGKIETGRDYDADNDGLIEVSNAAQLNAMRWDLDGDGASNASGHAREFPNAVAGMGCPSRCIGYELTDDLNLSSQFGSDAGWVPIGDRKFRWSATFEGNGRTISGMYISRGESENIGLFGVSDRGAVVRNVGLLSVNVHGSEVVGGLIGSNYGTIIACHVSGKISGSSVSSVVGGKIGGLVGDNWGTIVASFSAASVSSTGSWVGGLVGINARTVVASYSTGNVSGMGAVGGLVGLTFGTITSSYSIGHVSGTRDSVGGLFGGSRDDITTDSYWDTQTSGVPSDSGDAGKNTRELRAPTGYSGIYANWNVDIDGDGADDDPWDFGNANQYPVLKYGGTARVVQR